MNKEQRLQTIGRNIAYWRKLRGLSQIDMAEKLSISRTHVSNIEALNVKTSISIDLLLEIADVLNVPVEILFRDDNVTKKEGTS